MEEQILQSPWQKASQLKPKISSELQVYRRQFRGEQWYVLQRSGSVRLHRINPLAWKIIGQCDGRSSLDNIYNNLQASDPQLTETLLLEVISQFTREGIIHTAEMPAAVSPTATESWINKLKNPLAIRIPLWDPDRFLRDYLAWVAPIFSKTMLVIWLLVVTFAVFLAAMNWQALSNNVVDRVLSPDNLLLLWLIYPLTKTVHELGHAFATKIRGGEVHEIGVVFMFGVPLPYVDASAALTFPRKYQRLLVDAIGIMVELFIAAVALFVWLAVGDGLVSQLAYNAMIICGVSTLFFNGNPLMRFDGYYFLADSLEIPSLATRSMLYWRHRLNRYFRGGDEPFETADRELIWLLAYTPLALLYRLFVMVTIVFVAAQFYFPLGVVLGVWIIYQQLLKPVGKGLHTLLAPRLGEDRSRAIKSLSVVVIIAVAILFVIPFPVHRTVPAVVWLPDQAEIKAGAAGFVTEILSSDGAAVEKGQPLFRLSDPSLEMERNYQRARWSEVNVRLNAARSTDRVEAEQLEEDLKISAAELSKLEQDLAQLSVNSRIRGRFFLPPAVSSQGRYVQQGDLLGYILDRSSIHLRVMVSQEDIGMVMERNRGISIKLANWPAALYRGKIVRMMPSISTKLPSAVLGTQYGGQVGVDPTDSSGLRTLGDWFQLEADVYSSDREMLWAGSRAWVRFDLGYDPLWVQAYRASRQLFMNRLAL